MTYKKLDKNYFEKFVYLNSFDEAVQYRKNKLAELGVGYTTIHGGMK